MPDPKEKTGRKPQEAPEVSEQPAVEEEVVEAPKPEADDVEAQAIEDAQLEEKKDVIEEHEEDKEDALGIASLEVENLMGEVHSLEVFIEEGKVNTEKVKEFAAFIPVDVLYQLEDKRPGTLLDAFSTKTGESYAFDFKNNKEAEETLGLNVFFKNKPEIRELTVTSDPTRDKVEKGVREGYKGNFYDGEEYVEVMTGYTVEVTKSLDPDSKELAKLKKDWEKSMKSFGKIVNKKDKPKFKAFFEMLGGEKYADTPVAHIEQGDTLEEKLTYRIIEVSTNAGVDPYMTMSLLKAENGEGDKQFGVMMDDVNGFEAQLDWAVKYVKNYEISYERVSGKKAWNAGHYSVNFLAYCSEVYSPSAVNPNHFENVYKNYFKYRGIPPLAPGDLKKRKEKGKGWAEAFRHGGGWVPDERVKEVLKDGMNIRDIVPGWRGRPITGGSRFGMRMHPIDKVWKHHNGIDIGAPSGSRLNSWKDGEVVFAGWQGSGGNAVIIEHPDGSRTGYAHLNSINVEKNQKVQGGEQIGTIGSTGSSTAPHLHLTLKIDGHPVDPLSKV